MSESDDRRALDAFTVWFIECDHGGLGRPLNHAALPAFTVLVPGARAHTIGTGADMLHVAALLDAFEAGDTRRAAVLMGSPPASTS